MVIVEWPFHVSLKNTANDGREDGCCDSTRKVENVSSSCIPPSRGKSKDSVVKDMTMWPIRTRICRPLALTHVLMGLFRGTELMSKRFSCFTVAPSLSRCSVVVLSHDDASSDVVSASKRAAIGSAISFTPSPSFRCRMLSDSLPSSLSTVSRLSCASGVRGFTSISAKDRFCFRVDLPTEFSPSRWSV